MAEDKPLRRYEFQLTRDDQAAFVRECAPTSSLILPVMLISAIGIGALWAVLDDYQFTDLGRILACALVIALVHAGCKFYEFLADRRRVAQWPMPGRMIVEDRGTHLFFEENGTAKRYSWDNFGKIQLGKEHVYLCPTPQKAIIVPLRAFKDLADMTEFHRSAEQRAELSDAESAAIAMELQKPERPAIEVRIIDLASDAAKLGSALSGGPLLPMWKAALVIGILGGIISGGLAGIFRTQISESSWTVWAASAWPGSVVLSTLFFWYLERKMQGKYSSTVENLPRIVRLGADGLAISGVNFESRFAWAGISDISNVNGYIVFHLHSGGVVAVPWRCLDAMTPNEFYIAACAWQHSSQGSNNVQISS